MRQSVAAKELREFLPVLTRFDGEFRRLPREKPQNGIGASASETRNIQRNFTQSNSGHKRWKHNVESEGKDVLGF
jgi:hypothetical protein